MESDGDKASAVGCPSETVSSVQDMFVLKHVAFWTSLILNWALNDPGTLRMPHRKINHLCSYVLLYAVAKYFELVTLWVHIRNIELAAPACRREKHKGKTLLH